MDGTLDSRAFPPGGRGRAGRGDRLDGERDGGAGGGQKSRVVRIPHLISESGRRDGKSIESTGVQRELLERRSCT